MVKFFPCLLTAEKASLLQYETILPDLVIFRAVLCPFRQKSSLGGIPVAGNKGAVLQ